MADKKPPLSTQTSNQKCDRLDFDNDFGGKIASRGGSQQENSDLEDGEIFSCDSTDDETIEELTAKQKLLQSFLVEAEQNSSSCIEEGEINDQINTVGDLDPKVTGKSPVLNGKDIKSKGEKLNLKKTVHEHKIKDYHPKKSPDHSKERKRENTKGQKDVHLKTSDKTESKVKKGEKEDKNSTRLEFNSFLAECKKTRGGQTTTVKSKSRQCPHNKSPERKMEYDNKYHLIHKQETCCQMKKGEIFKVNDRSESDNFEEMMDNLDEIPVDSSNSDNENDERVDDIKTDSSNKRKHSSETHSPINPEQFDKPANKKIKTDEADANSDDYKSFPHTQEFQIIDDLNADEDDDCRLSEEEGMMDMDDDYMSDDLDDNEIYAWLEEGISTKHAVDNETDEILPVDEKDKSVLLEKGVDLFEVLPEGWVAVTHNSGMPAYLHKQTRVCTLSKPYFLGPGSVRKHDIPVSAIPCLQYRKEIEKERQQKNNETGNQQNVESGNQTPVLNGAVNCPIKENGISEAESIESSDVRDTSADDTTDLDKTLTFDEKMEDSGLDSTKTKDDSRPMAGPPVKIETVEERKKENSLSADEVLEYCKSLFQFKTVTVKKFKTWKERRKHLNEVRKQSRPALPANTKLITCSITADDGTDKPKKKEFILNPVGKSPVCILHEYAQHTLKVQPRYAFQELENAQNPYCATVIINNVEYGKGYASSKKLAKMNAAKATLGILIPEMNNLIDDVTKEEKEDLSFFDEIKIEDPRVFDLCTKTGQPSPYQILLECLKRNYGMGDTHVKTDVKTLKHQKSEYSLSVGKHSVTIVCKNKREGKQRAAQAMLQQLHTHINSLGSLLRLYGQSSGKIFKEKKKEEESITELQTQTHSNKPNTALLDKLRKEMTKLQSQRKSLTSKGSLLIDSVPGGITSLDL